MRALIVASASREIAIVPSMIWVTNCFTKSRPRSTAAALRASRPSDTIWSSRVNSFSVACSAATGATAVAVLESVMGTSFGLRQGQFRPQLLHLLRVADRLHQDLVQLVVALQAAAQVAQL